MSVVVLAWGNDVRGDDGIGPALAAHIAHNWPSVALTVDEQPQIEHALELHERSLVLFIDAGRQTHAPYSFREIVPESDFTHTSHSLSPESVLDVARRIRMPIPPSFVLCVAGENWNVGQSLSTSARSHVRLASEFIDRLLARPDACRWRDQVELNSCQAVRH